MDAKAAATRVRRFEEQILPYLPEIYRAARRLTRHAQDAEDLVQETCLRAFRAFDQLQRPQAAKAWVFTVLRSVLMRDATRWDPTRPMRQDAEAEIAQRSLTTADGESPWHGALLEEARLATLRLPIAFREVIVLAHVGGFSYREMALILGVPIGTVMSRLSRGRELLRLTLGGLEPQPTRSETAP